jgi:hypothetical protein
MKQGVSDLLKACVSAAASWSAVALHRFCIATPSQSTRGLAQSKTWRQPEWFIKSWKAKAKRSPLITSAVTRTSAY